MKISVALHTRVSANINLVEQEFLQVTENIQKFLKLQLRTQLPVTSKRVG